MRSYGTVIKSDRQLEVQILLDGLPGVLAFLTQLSKVRVCPFSAFKCIQ